MSVVVKSLKEILLEKYTDMYINNDNTRHLALNYIYQQHTLKFKASLDVIYGVGDYYRDNIDNCIVKIRQTEEGKYTYKIKQHTNDHFYVIHGNCLMVFRRSPLGPRLVHYMYTTSTTTSTT